MKKTIWSLMLGLAAVMVLAGCKPENESDDVSFDEADLVGKWLLDDTQEYWRYDSGHYGETWDESEDVNEGEGTTFSWDLDGKTLTILLTGEMGQVVPYDYTVQALTASAMSLKDDFDNTKTYHKI